MDKSTTSNKKSEPETAHFSSEIKRIYKIYVIDEWFDFKVLR